MKTLKIYYIDNNYINYLRKFDNRVAYNKSKARPYVGVVYTFNNQTYFAPLSSPKPKHLTMKNIRNKINFISPLSLPPRIPIS